MTRVTKTGGSRKVPPRNKFDRFVFADDFSEEQGGRVNALAKMRGDVKHFWNFQGEMFALLDDAHKEMRDDQTSDDKAKGIAETLRKKLDDHIADYSREVQLAKANAEFEQDELRRIAIEQFPDLAEEEFIIVANGVLSAGDPPDEINVR